jgi:hypothetical protein
MKYRFLLAVALICSICVNAQADTEQFEKIVGRWLRSDGGYVLVIEKTDEEGNLSVQYLNPRPVNVSQAKAETKENALNVFVELKDKYYPGSYYELIYDEKSDKFIGTYHHLGINQAFDVYFVREE